jgi:hypothetical protein
MNQGLRRVISGGQTGADLAGLRAARHLGIKTGGTAPAGELSETLKDFGLHEYHDGGGGGGGRGEKARNLHPNVALVLRSKANVDNSDATIAFRVRASPGTDKTIQYCVSGKWQSATFNLDDTKDASIKVGGWRPVLIIQRMTPEAQVAVRDFITDLGVRVLNVAGHRNVLGDPGWEDAVEQFLIKSLSPAP